MRNQTTLALVALASLTVTACGKPAGPPQMPPPAVSVATPLTQNVVDWDDFTGRFEAPEQVQVRARTGGYLQQVHFKDGQFVRKGQLLFTLDPRPAQAALAAAQAQAQSARSELRRAQSLLEAQAFSREEFEARRAASLVAEATLRARQLDLEFTRVTAPISGVVSDRRVDPGNVISGGTSNGDILTTVVSTNPIHFVFDASEAQYLRYQREATSRSGAPVRIRLQDEAEPRWNGRLEFSDNALDPNSGAVRLRAAVNNPNGFLKPGMFGSARMAATGSYPALLVPEAAVVSDGPRKVVYVAQANGDVLIKPVQTGPTTGGLRVIRSGIRPDDRVIVNGLQRVRPGQKVQAKLTTISRTEQAAATSFTPALSPAATATPAN